MAPRFRRHLRSRSSVRNAPSSRTLRLTTFRSGATISPIISGVIARRFVRHSGFDLRLEFLRLLYDRIEFRKYLR